MTFDEVLDQAIEMLRRRGRVSYRALKRQFDLDDAYLEDLKAEIITVHRLATDQHGEMLVWIGDSTSAPLPEAPVRDQEREPLSYTPKHLTEKILASRSALAGERKQVTVLFADLKGSLELLADRDPEEARQILDPVLERMMEAVHRYEGTVNQVMGDGIMALFGAPLAHEDHAVRACYAALRMQETVHQYGEAMQRSHGVPIHIRVGLNSGEVVVRSIDSDLHMDYSAIGQTTHLAARMEQMARPGSVLATDETLRLAEGYVQVKALGPVPVRGLQAPIEVYEILGATLLRSRLHVAAARGLTRFVGRDAEMTQLRRALEQARAGHGQAVGVVGEAGVGKSRLFFEFVHSHRTQGWLVLESSSVSYGKATSYLPIIDLLKGYFQIEDRDTTQRLREKVTGKVLTLDEQLKDAIPPLLSLLGALPEDDSLRSLDPPYRRSLVLDALKRLLVRESQRQPLLLVFEDLHWVDAESQTALDMLVNNLPTSRLLLLTNYRPEYNDHWTSKTYYTRLRVDPLPPQDADELLAALLGTDPSLEPLKALLKERTGGNPFFLEESVRTLVEAEALRGERGAYRLVHDLRTMQIPATVQALLAARIDRLPFEEKQLLQSAAVIGTDVPLVLLQEIADLSEDDLRRGLAHLQEGEFLYETRLFPDPEYTFKHALTHDVAYSSLLHERRRLLHRRVGQAIEARYAGRLAECAEMLANQFERGEDWAKAVHYHVRAAEKVKEQHAYQNAVQLCTRALALAANVKIVDEERVWGLVLLGDLWSLMGDVEQANQCYKQAMETTPDTTVRQQIANKYHHLHTVVRNGARIAFYEHGSGDVTLVFLHPLAYNPASFQPLVEALCQEFRIITIDPRGRGASDPLSGPYTLQQHAEDARAVIEAVATGPIVGVGLSKWGALLVKLAVAYPSLVQKLVLVSSHPAPSEQNSRHGDWLDEVKVLLGQGQKERALRLWFSILLPEPGMSHLLEQTVQAAQSLSTESLLHHITPDPEDDIVSLCPQVLVPTLVMNGTADRRAPVEAGRYLAEHIPGAQFYPFNGKGHGLIYTATSEFCEVLRCFVRTGGVPAR
jgi:class 3 adenylate cyclase/pimeloyl-ACP methyl ester carboxylesterase